MASGSMTWNTPGVPGGRFRNSNAPLLPDDGFYRLDAYECYNNMGIWLDRSCINCFHSTVAPHILEFYPTVGVTRDVNSKPELDLYALRGLLSVRYTIVRRRKLTALRNLQCPAGN